MARIAREHIVTPEGGFFHVYNRVAGAARYFPFRQPRVRRKFIRWLRYCLRSFCIDCAGFVLMGNHYHLVVQVPEFRELSVRELHLYAQARWGRRWKLRTRNWTEQRWLKFNRDLFSLDVFMRDLQGPFASWFNRLFERRGHLWAERYKSVKLEDLRAVQECLFYIELNPVRAGLCKRPEEWKEGSASMRWRGRDRYLMDLGEIFPESARHRVYADYRAGLRYRGMSPSEAMELGMDAKIAGMEVIAGFVRPGLYLRRLRFLTEGLILATADTIQDHLDRLRVKGVYKRRRNSIPQLDGLFFTLREQRGQAGC